MHEDEIIAEVWRNRDAYVEAHHNDLDEIVDDLRKREGEHLQRVVDRRTQGTSETSPTSR